MKKWAIGVVSSVIFVPMIAVNWTWIQKVWAAPAEIRVVDNKVESMAQTQKEQASLMKGMIDLQKDLQYRQDKSETVTNMQIAALKEVVKEIKKK